MKSSARSNSSMVTRAAKTCVGAYAPALLSEMRMPSPSAWSHSAGTSSRSSPSNADTIASAPDRRAGPGLPEGECPQARTVLPEARHEGGVDRARQAMRELELEHQLGLQAIGSSSPCSHDVRRRVPATREGVALRDARVASARARESVDARAPPPGRPLRRDRGGVTSTCPSSRSSVARSGSSAPSSSARRRSATATSGASLVSASSTAASSPVTTPAEPAGRSAERCAATTPGGAPAREVPRPRERAAHRAR